jgi:hypothetical protein
MMEAANNFAGGWKKATNQTQRLHCISEFLSALRVALSNKLPPDADELLKALSQGFRDLQEGEQSDLFKKAVRRGLSAREVRNRVYLRIGYDLLLEGGKPPPEALKETLKYAKRYKIQPKTRGPEEKPKESLQHALTNLVADSRNKDGENAEADSIYRAIIVSIKVLQARSSLSNQELPSFYFDEYLPMLLGLKSKTPNWRARFLNEESDCAKAEVTLKSMRRTLRRNSSAAGHRRKDRR